MVGSRSLEKAEPQRNIAPVSNRLQFKYLVCGAWCVVAAAAVACGHKPETSERPQPTAPLPTAALAGREVLVLPITLLAAEDSLRWGAVLTDRRATLARADSVIGTLLKARVPEVTWILPEELRRAARGAPGIATDPDQMGTAILRARNVTMVPDPLRSQLRTLAALARGSVYALVPAALIYRRTVARSDGRTVVSGGSAVATAELAIVLADVRLGRVGWRTVATGEGDDPWSALTRAVKGLTPGLP